VSLANPNAKVPEIVGLRRLTPTYTLFTQANTPAWPATCSTANWWLFSPGEKSPRRGGWGEIRIRP